MHTIAVVRGLQPLTAKVPRLVETTNSHCMQRPCCDDALLLLLTALLHMRATES